MKKIRIKNPWFRKGINRSLESPVKIEWKGDLEDDCHARVGYLSAHCERMGDVYVVNSRNGKNMRCEMWFCSVDPVDKKGWVTGDSIFHSGEPGGLILSGTMARAICESIIRAHYLKLTTRKRKVAR